MGNILADLGPDWVGHVFQESEEIVAAVFQDDCHGGLF